MIRRGLTAARKQIAEHEQYIRSLLDEINRLTTERAKLHAALRSSPAVPEGYRVVLVELPVDVMIEVCGSDHPGDYQQVARDWKLILELLAASPNAQEEKK